MTPGKKGGGAPPPPADSACGGQPPTAVAETLVKLTPPDWGSGDPRILQTLYWASAVFVRKGEPVPEELRGWLTEVLLGLSRDATWAVDRALSPADLKQQLKNRLFVSTGFRKATGRPPATERQLKLSDAVCELLLDRAVPTLDKAFDQVAEEHHVAKSTVTAAWYMHRDKYLPIDWNDGEEIET